MTAGISQILNTAKSALSTSQVGLATTSHNVSNVNTEGYSRQRVDQAANDPSQYGKHQIGTGVKVKQVIRTHSDFVARRLEEEKTSLGRFEGLSDVYNQIENVFKNEAEGGVSASISQFFNDVRALSAQPESVPLKSAVKEAANAVSARFKSLNASLNDVRNDIDRRVDGSIENINSLTSRIASLNKRIMEMTTVGYTPNDELDSRDMAVQELSKLIPLQITNTENGGINIASGRTGVIVTGSDSYNFVARRTGDAAGGGGGMHIFVAPETESQKTLKDVTETFTDGAVGAFLKLREQKLPQLNEKLDKLAFQFANSVNEAHREGYSKGSASGAGMEFFSIGPGLNGASERIALSKTIDENPSFMATGYVKGASGDNRVLLKIADLQDARIYDGGNSNITDYASGLVGTVGIDSKAVYENLSTQRDLVGQLEAMREQISGVSLDEEAINMLKFQKAFDASAKMIQAADQMYDTILNLKRF